MSWGEPTKLRAACEIAGALGYIGLVNYDRVSANTFGEKATRALSARVAAKARRDNCLTFWKNLSLTAWLTSPRRRDCLSLQSRRSGLAIVISDFLFPEGYETGLKTLGRARFRDDLHSSSWRAKSWSRHCAAI